MFPNKFILAFLIIAASYSVCNCTIILDSGNPSRFIRGTFMDVNHPEVKETSININQEQEQVISLDENPGFAQVMAESIINELTAYNEAMTEAMIAEAKDISGLAALTSCQFSRSRVTSLSLINAFRALIVKLAMAEVQDINMEEASKVSAIVASEMSSLETLFARMTEDLHHFSEAKHGTTAMSKFENATRDFKRLSDAISENE